MKTSPGTGSVNTTTEYDLGILGNICLFKKVVVNQAQTLYPNTKLNINAVPMLFK